VAGLGSEKDPLLFLLCGFSPLMFCDHSSAAGRLIQLGDSKVIDETKSIMNSKW
jgi:hypothetical protein